MSLSGDRLSDDQSNSDGFGPGAGMGAAKPAEQRIDAANRAYRNVFGEMLSASTGDLDAADGSQAALFGAQLLQTVRRRRHSRSVELPGLSSTSDTDEDADTTPMLHQDEPKLLNQTRGLPAWREMGSHGRKVKIALATLFMGLIGAAIINGAGASGGPLQAFGALPHFAGQTVVGWVLFAIMFTMLGMNYGGDAIAKLRNWIYTDQENAENTVVQDLHKWSKRVRKVVKKANSARDAAGAHQLTAEQQDALMRTVLTHRVYTLLEREARVASRVDDDAIFISGPAEYAEPSAKHDDVHASIESALTYLQTVKGVHNGPECVEFLNQLKALRHTLGAGRSAWLIFEAQLAQKIQLLDLTAEEKRSLFQKVLVACSAHVQADRAQVYGGSLEFVIKNIAGAEAIYTWAVDTADSIHSGRLEAVRDVFAQYGESDVERELARDLLLTAADEDWARLDRTNFADTVTGRSKQSKMLERLNLTLFALLSALVASGFAVAIGGSAVLSSWVVMLPVVSLSAALGVVLRATQLAKEPKDPAGQYRNRGNLVGWANAFINGGGTLLGTLTIAGVIAGQSPVNAMSYVTTHWNVAVILPLALMGYFSGVIASWALTRGSTAELAGSLGEAQLYYRAQGVDGHWLRAAWRDTSGRTRIALATGALTGIGLGVFGYLSCAAMWPGLMHAFHAPVTVSSAANILWGSIGAVLSATTAAFLLAKFAKKVFDQNVRRQIAREHDVSEYQSVRDVVAQRHQANATDATACSMIQRWWMYTRKHPVRSSIQSLFVVVGAAFFTEMIVIDAVQYLGTSGGIGFDMAVGLPCFVVFAMMFAVCSKAWFKPGSETTRELFGLSTRNIALAKADPSSAPAPRVAVGAHRLPRATCTPGLFSRRSALSSADVDASSRSSRRCLDVLRARCPAKLCSTD